MARAAAPWPLYARLLPILLALLFYSAATTHFRGVAQLKWHANTVAASNAGILLSSRSDASKASKAVGAVTSSSQSTDDAKAATAAAAKQPVVIGLHGSGQWPFWQAISSVTLESGHKPTCKDLRWMHNTLTG
jgi:hypothetical protein